jgi:hypothetical protein
VPSTDEPNVPLPKTTFHTAGSANEVAASYRHGKNNQTKSAGAGGKILRPDE